jgi:hypothetical protein
MAEAGTSQGSPKSGAEKAITPAIEISSESMGQFVSRVQPILMNTCASCHVGEKGGAFKLARATEGGTVSRRATQQNLATVLGHLTLARPEVSPLLVKAVSIHGDANQPPIKSRQSPPYRAIEEWIRATIANNPQLQDSTAGAPAAGTPEKKGAPQAAPVQAGLVAGAPVSSSKPAVPAPSPGMPAAAIPVDPFDPAAFNQQAKSKK